MKKIKEYIGLSMMILGLVMAIIMIAIIFGVMLSQPDIPWTRSFLNNSRLIGLALLGCVVGFIGTKLW